MRLPILRYLSLRRCNWLGLGQFLRPAGVGAGLVLGLLAGCGSDPGMRDLSDQLERLRGKVGTDPAFAAAEAAHAPAIVVAVDRRPRAVALLRLLEVSDHDGTETWIAPDGGQLLFRGGILVGSRGFGGDVLASDVAELALLLQSHTAGYATRLMTVLEGDDQAVTLAMRCRVSPNRIDTVDWGEGPVSTQTMVEDCRGTRTSFENYYWIVPHSGEIVQSSQWAGPFTQKLSMRKMMR